MGDLNPTLTLRKTIDCPTYTGVDDAFANAAFEEAGTAVAAEDAVVLAVSLISANSAGHWYR